MNSTSIPPTTTNNEISFNSLPIDFIINIFTNYPIYINGEEVLEKRRVCKFWNQTITKYVGRQVRKEYRYNPEYDNDESRKQLSLNDIDRMISIFDNITLLCLRSNSIIPIQQLIQLFSNNNNDKNRMRFCNSLQLIDLGHMNLQSRDPSNDLNTDSLRSVLNHISPPLSTTDYNCSCSSSSRLMYLDISLNVLDREGIELVRDRILFNNSMKDIQRSLQFLNLSSCITSGDDLNHLFSGVGGSDMGDINLVYLNIGYNFIEWTGCQSICNLLKSTKTLKCLVMPYCAIKDTGLLMLADGLKDNKTLLSLDLSGNGFSQNGGNQFIQILKSSNNDTLKFLNVELTAWPLQHSSEYSQYDYCFTYLFQHDLECYLLNNLLKLLSV
eukprot:gene7445-9150_t